jgi:urease accessory protein
MTITRLMRALQFGDSMLPVGAFSFSNGLEAAVQQSIVHDVESLRAFVLTATQQAASVDGIALLEAHRAGVAQDLGRILAADSALFNRKLNEEIRTMTVRMGKKLAETGGHVLSAPLLAGWLAAINRGETPGAYPVGLGILFAGMDLPEHAAFAVHQYGVATMMLGASLRLMKVSHLDTQAILYEINAGAESAYERHALATLDDMAVFAPLFDILAAVHVTSHLRMFMD